MAGTNLPHNQILIPGNFSELFSLRNRIPNAVPYAGGTALVHSRINPDRGFSEQPELPSEILSLEKIADMRSITRTERYLEIGAMVRLGEIIALGKIVPNAFSQTLQGISGPLIRNLATIGGNICTGGDCIAPLCALDAVYELRDAERSRWISSIRFSSVPDGLQKDELLTRIRIPLEEWDYTIYRKFNNSDSAGEGGVLILMVRIQKNVLTNIQVVFTGGGTSFEADPVLLRNKDSEVILEGKALPLDKRNILHYIKLWETYLEDHKSPGPLLKEKILNEIESGIAGLSD
jgi:CO/xanthine dehydrogenase FAD-binding subunit